jgi:hypothetical protein
MVASNEMDVLAANGVSEVGCPIPAEITHDEQFIFSFAPRVCFRYQTLVHLVNRLKRPSTHINHFLVVKMRVSPEVFHVRYPRYRR